jgi:Calcineurin-like phosphoesterase
MKRFKHCFRHKGIVMTRKLWMIAVALFALAGAGSGAKARAQKQKAGQPQWRFAVSGDSRDCGDVVMPEIAAAVLQDRVDFYWHIGDFRKIYDFDEDMKQEPEYRKQPMNILYYEYLAWPDFVRHQLDPFGSLPVFLTIGNHEVMSPKTRADYIAQFGDWLDTRTIREQRLRDNPNDHQIKTYYHWVMNHIDFYSLDDATPDEFDSSQLRWFESVLKRDEHDPSIDTLVVGMHEPLPNTISGYNMAKQFDGTSYTGLETGHRVGAELLQAQNNFHKRVYILAGHDHFYLEGSMNTDYWRTHGGVLPTWTIGTAGATWYPLPDNANEAIAAKTNVYGYIVGTVQSDGQIQFQFHPIAESQVEASVVNEFTPQFVHWCFTENTSANVK